MLRRPRRSPRAGAYRCVLPRRSSDRTARNPSAVTSPRATPSHSASSTSSAAGRSASRGRAGTARRAGAARRARRGSGRWPARPGSSSPRAARSSHGRSSRMASVIGVARDGVRPLRRAARSGSVSRTDSRPQQTWPDRHSSSSHSRRYPSTRAARTDRSPRPRSASSKPCSCSMTARTPNRPSRLVPVRDVLPAQQEPHEVPRGDRLDLAPRRCRV